MPTVRQPRRVRSQPGGHQQVREAAKRADAHDGDGPGQLGSKTTVVAGREAHQAEQVEGNHEQDAEQDRDQHGGGRKPLHAWNSTRR